MLDRTPANVLADGCVLSSVRELEAGKVLQPYPVPSKGLVRLKDVRPGELFVLRALDGRAVMQDSYRDGVELGALPSGVYVLEMIAYGSRARLVRE